LRLAKVIVKNKVSRFLWFSVYKHLPMKSLKSTCLLTVDAKKPC